MARPQIRDDARVAAFVLGASRTRYLVMRQEDVWFITFNGEEFGPYRSEREAMLFATDAAHKLGELGEDTQVFRVDENGAAEPVWDLRSRPLSAGVIRHLRFCFCKR
jgi:hypothetical protein